MEFLDELLRVLAALDRHGVAYVLVGGAALNIHGIVEHMTVSVRGVPVRVATPRTLHWMKRDTVRALDHADAQLLQEAFDFEPKK